MKLYRIIFVLGVLTGALFSGNLFAGGSNEPPRISEFWTEQPSLTRAGRELTVLAVVENLGEQPVKVAPEFIVPAGIEIRAGSTVPQTIPVDGKVSFRWTISAPQPIYAEVKLNIINMSTDGHVCSIGRLPVRFLPARACTPSDVIPAPQRPKKTSKLLVGAHNCPLWNREAGVRWDQLMKHPERTPALGFYAQESPEVADWETKWAAEHGVDFFIYCWYRTSQGEAVKYTLGEAIHDALFNSRYQKDIKFTIMWENQNRGFAGVADEKDLLNNLFPFWMENYFKKDNYLKIDNKPVLFIYRPEFLITDLGGVDKVHSAFDKLRAESKKAGFDGLIILGEYRGTDAKHLQKMKKLGLDYTFAYCQQLSHSPNPQSAIERQMDILKTVQQIGILPQIVTVSQAWSGWHDEGSIWKLPPEEFEVLLRRAVAFIDTMPKDQLGSKMIILDNWNEWSEGHYLLPYTEYGFGYLDAIARVFTDQKAKHEDLLPGDIGKGPYDTYYRKWREDLRTMPADPDVWKFDTNVTGWESMMGIEKFQILDKKLNVLTKTSDPAMRINLKKYKRANLYQKVRVRMKVSGLNGKSTYSQFLWINKKSEDWSEPKSIRLPVIDNGKFNDYVFEVGRSSNWKNQIAGLRFDFVSLPKVTVEIKEIALEK